MFGFAQIGIPSLILILVVALIIFGPGKLPSVVKAMGETISSFKKAVSDNDDVTEEEKKKELAASSGGGCNGGFAGLLALFAAVLPLCAIKRGKS